MSEMPGRRAIATTSGGTTNTAAVLAATLGLAAAWQRRQPGDLRPEGMWGPMWLRRHDEYE